MAMNDISAQSAANPCDSVDGSPLDPYVDLVVRWIAGIEGGAPAGGLSLSIATTFDWPAPFAEVVLAGVNGRRLLRPIEMSNRPLRLVLSRRGETWLDARIKPN
jgi:hypothetical protein